MSRSFLYLAGLAGAISLAAACSANSSSSVFGSGGGGSDSSGSGSTKSGGNATAGAGGSSGDGSGGGFDPTSGSGGSTGSGTTCESSPDEDKDKDGFSVNQGDCNDCDPNVNPGAIEVIAQPDADGGVPMPADEDCDGTVDNVPQPCDDGLQLTDQNPLDGAKSIELCQQAGANDKKWGVISAKYTRANGGNWVPGPEVGIQSAWGPNVHVQGGKNMLVVSSGHARLPNQPDACNQNSCSVAGAGTPPPGFPQDGAQCQGGSNINDDVGLELHLRAPTNATGYSFNFDFYSFEYPEWVCTTFNDQFIALVSPAPMGAKNGNISFDSNGNPVSVNIAFFDVCQGCPLGTSQLIGTGFEDIPPPQGFGDDAGATGWLETQAPVTGGQEFTIRFAIWDTGDTAWDSTALIDNFQWIANGGTVAIGTDPIPVPK